MKIMPNQKTSTIPPHIEERRILQPPFRVSTRKGRASSLTVACILDDLSMTSFAPEADFQALTMRDWLVELTASQPDLLFVESAWRGHRETWWNEVQRCGPELRGILNWCKSRSIPTVFWNKEDPVHYSTFLNAAQLFDVVFTTDVDCVPRYRASLGHDRVYFLPFAAQPKYHNPIEEFDRVRGVSFAGAYYKKYPIRNRDFNELSNVLKETGRLEIYDRNYALGAEDQQFPEEIRSLVVGGLTPEDISVAYKGYTYSLNLNSVKESQSMFARRVFELMASNTAVISNYSRGLKVMFSDLAIATDGAEQLKDRLTWISSQPNGLERIRNMAIRKVFNEHTYAKRLEEIAIRAGIKLPPASVDKVLLICPLSTERHALNIVKLLQAQQHSEWELVFIGGSINLNIADDRRIHFLATLDDLKNFDRGSFTHFGCLHPNDWYGPNYLWDILTVFQWAEVECVGHAERFSFSDEGLVKVQAGTAWTYQTDLNLSRSVRRFRENEQVWEAYQQRDTPIGGLATSSSEYCENGIDATADQLAPFTDLDIDEGISLNEFQEFAQRLNPEAELEASGFQSGIDPADLFEEIQEVSGLSVSVDNGKISIESSLETDKHQYAYSRVPIDPVMLPDTNGGEVYFEATPGLNVMLAFVYYSEDGDRLGHSMIGNSRNTSVAWPENTSKVKVGIRVMGPGSTVISSYSRRPRQAAIQPSIATESSLIVTNRYPSYEALYQNGFVASRAESYLAAGFRTEIFCVEAKESKIGHREFNGIQVTTGNADQLEAFVSFSRQKRILVHFLSEEIWDVLRRASQDQEITVWVHGFEAQPWWRRASLYTDAEERKKAVQVSDARMKFWKEVFSSVSENWHFVFVSEYLAQQVFDDVGVSLAPSQFSVISNIVDTELFPYREKPLEQRFKVLSIRPYASNIYANDLAVKAVLHLSEMCPEFERFEFAFYGDGILFDETLEPLKDFSNVKISRGFLTRSQIAEVHRDYGLFLVPSRMDTQGVSRGEAMASGLVPITNSVAAIPEFVDHDSGMLVDAEDFVGLAEAMQFLAENPEEFARLSAAAANRVERELGFCATISREIKLVWEN